MITPTPALREVARADRHGRAGVVLAVLALPLYDDFGPDRLFRHGHGPDAQRQHDRGAVGEPERARAAVAAGRDAGRVPWPSEVYENVPVLGHLPAAQFRPADGLDHRMGGPPEQGCAYCHGDSGNFAADDHPIPQGRLPADVPDDHDHQRRLGDLTSRPSGRHLLHPATKVSRCCPTSGSAIPWPNGKKKKVGGDGRRSGGGRTSPRRRSPMPRCRWNPFHRLPGR